MAKADSTGEGWVDSHYVQQSHTRVWNYYLPCRQGPSWLNVHLVIHTCKLTREVVFDEEVTDENRLNFREIWERACDHPGGLISSFYYRGTPINSIKERSQGDESVEASGPEAKLQ